MKKHNKKMTIRLPLSIGCLLLGAGLFSAGAGNAFDFSNGKAIKRANGTWYTDFATIEESHEHADKVNIQIMEESSILMKNDNNALPLQKGSGVSVLGNLSYHVVTGGTGSGGGGALRVDMVSGLEKSGFKVNGLAKDFYSTLTSTANISSGMFSGGSGQQVQEDPSVLTPIEDSLRNYKTVIWTIGRTGGEGSDLMTNSHILIPTVLKVSAMSLTVPSHLPEERSMYGMPTIRKIRPGATSVITHRTPGTDRSLIRNPIMPPTISSTLPVPSSTTPPWSNMKKISISDTNTMKLLMPKPRQETIPDSTMTKPSSIPSDMVLAILSSPRSF